MKLMQQDDEQDIYLYGHHSLVLHTDVEVVGTTMYTPLYIN